ncbi:cation:proton antiporter [Streptomyces sp. F001]|uniref:cation:proton antiporter n=1 Tax=Streptomyces sp. F001 TaxID=1510026 RepID=UPI00101E6615|nr:cation:proton antiporter [Streptomyces sp. F001]RZB16800.1 cation:proton antiporter [Streptomyces sp. F001]
MPYGGPAPILAAGPVAPLGQHSLLLLLLQVGVLLALALLFGRLAVRWGMPAVVGELLVGVLLGPSLLERFAPALTDWLFPKEAGQFHLLDAFSQIGLMLLVGVTGTQLNLGLLRRQGTTALRVSVGGLVVPLAFGIGVAFLLPDRLVPGDVDRAVFAFFLGVAMCVSALPVIAKTLSDMGFLHRPVGQLILTAGMVDDTVAWFLLSLVTALATVGLTMGHVGLALASLAAFLVLACTVGRMAVRAVLRRTARSAEPGATVAAVVVMVLLSAAGAHALHQEPLFGAFVCGLVISSTGELAPNRLAALRTVVMAVFAPVFFAAAGLMDTPTPIRLAGAAFLLLFVAVLGKFLGAYAGARLSRRSRWEALALGAGMNARGVVEVVIAMAGLRLGVLTTQMYTVIVLIAVVTSLMAPPILTLAMKRIEDTAEETAEPKSPEEKTADEEIREKAYG